LNSQKNLTTQHFFWLPLPPRYSFVPSSNLLKLVCTHPEESKVELNEEKEQGKFDGQISGKAC